MTNLGRLKDDSLASCLVSLDHLGSVTHLVSRVSDTRLLGSWSSRSVSLPGHIYAQLISSDTN